jgi:hypothetical protein
LSAIDDWDVRQNFDFGSVADGGEAVAITKEFEKWMFLGCESFVAFQE